MVARTLIPDFKYLLFLDKNAKKKPWRPSCLRSDETRVLFGGKEVLS